MPDLELGFPTSEARQIALISSVSPRRDVRDKKSRLALSSVHCFIPAVIDLETLLRPPAREFSWSPRSVFTKSVGA